jgi:hypothetical protein
MQNNTSTSPGGEQANVGNSGEPRGPNLIALGHTGRKTGGETLTPDEQHREMSQHELRGQHDRDEQKGDR